MALLVTPVLIHSPPTIADAVKRGWLAKDALKRALSTAAGTAPGFQLLLVAQTVLLAPVHDLSVANADWLIRSMATAMIWMVMTNTLLGHLFDTCELIVEQNFIGGGFWMVALVNWLASSLIEIGKGGECPSLCPGRSVQRHFADAVVSCINK